MKKTLLLSVVASTMIMAGGDIAPVEPVVETPAVVSGWEFSGQGVVYYQTIDSDLMGGGSLFDQENSQADAGIQLRATNNDVIGGLGMGFAVNGLSTLNLENYLVSGVMQMTSEYGDIDDISDGGWISEAYVTYGFGNTSIKAGRQTLPKALSPFAFSEDWNVFQNTYDGILVVNTDISNTTIVGAWVAGCNVNSMMMSDLTDFNSINEDDGVYMLTVQNTSIANLTLTGTWYYAGDFVTSDDLNILWGDAQYNADSFNVGVQGGQVSHDAFDDDITSFGAKIGTTFAGINAEVAYSSVNDGGAFLPQPGITMVPLGAGAFNIGGTTSALYTSTMADELVGSSWMTADADKWVVRANMEALGGKIGALYAMSDSGIIGDTNEFDVSYSTKVGESLDLSATYMNADNDYIDSSDVVRVIARYNF